MKGALRIVLLTFMFAPFAAYAQSSRESDGPPTKTTFVRLGSDANAIIVEPIMPDPNRSRIAILITHPDLDGPRQALNNFNGGGELAKYGYRVMLLNYYGVQLNYYEYLAPIAAAIKALRALPGVQKVVLEGHSTGGAELSAYQDVAENGAKACQEPGRITKCQAKDLGTLAKADGVMLLESAMGAPERTVALNPAVGPHGARRVNPDIDGFDPRNGFNPATKSATYSPQFMQKYFAAQAARANQLVDEAQTRLAKIEKGAGAFGDDEPFVVTGSDTHATGAQLAFADSRLLSRTHGSHLLLKADGSRPVQVISLDSPTKASPEDQGMLYRTVMMSTVRYYLSFQAMRLESNYAMTENNVTGVHWRDTPNSVPGNLEGVRVPTLVMAGTCAVHLVFSEIAYDHSAASDREFVGVEGANHGLRPCKPGYGDTLKRSYDFVDGWLTKPGRF